MAVGMILEGGAMRGLYTAGVIDVLLENDVKVDAVIGVSAGTTFGCNYKSKQIGRTLRYNLKYINDPRYASVRSLIKTGDYFGAEFCYNDIPYKLDPFDIETYQKTPVKFYSVSTECQTGKPEYTLLEYGDKRDVEWMRASASMPLVSQPVEINGKLYLDGGISDSIPIRWFEKQGYKKNIVVLTQPKGYKKSKNKLLPLMSIAMKKYPGIIKAMKTRHKKYNQSLFFVERSEREGTALVLRPSRDLGIGRMEKDVTKLREMYELGRSDCLERLEEIKKYVSVS